MRVNLDEWKPGRDDLYVNNSRAIARATPLLRLGIYCEFTCPSIQAFIFQSSDTNLARGVGHGRLEEFQRTK